jgi:hypothetical protein
VLSGAVLFKGLSQEVADNILDVGREFAEYPLQDKDAKNNQDNHHKEAHHSIALPLKWVQLPFH